MIRPLAVPSETVIRRQTCPFRIRNKIEVIKNYRETTDVGLTEAKKSIERAERSSAGSARFQAFSLRSRNYPSLRGRDQIDFDPVVWLLVPQKQSVS